MDRLRASIAG